MNVDELTDLVMDKFKKNRGYIETDEKHMRGSIRQYLSDIYRYDMEYAVMSLEHDKMSGKTISKQDYVDEMRNVEDSLVEYAELLAITSKEELENFV